MGEDISLTVRRRTQWLLTDGALLFFISLSTLYSMSTRLALPLTAAASMSRMRFVTGERLLVPAGCKVMRQEMRTSADWENLSARIQTVVHVVVWYSTVSYQSYVSVVCISRMYQSYTVSTYLTDWSRSMTRPACCESRPTQCENDSLSFTVEVDTQRRIDVDINPPTHISHGSYSNKPSATPRLLSFTDTDDHKHRQVHLFHSL